jgi:hypothetical protein
MPAELSGAEDAAALAALAAGSSATTLSFHGNLFFPAGCSMDDNMSPEAPIAGIAQPRRVCVFTANRADYSKLRPLMLALQNDVRFALSGTTIDAASA